MIEPGFRLLSLRDIGWTEELPETHATLEENSLQKAQTVFDKIGMPCFADDTGLEVEALGGAPGVYSARYAGEKKDSDDNIELLLKNLRGQSNRRARFRTVITLVGLGAIMTFEGVVNGVITEEKKGRGGFGYDPVFLPDGFTRTMAEMTTEEKNALSHRGRAARALVSFLNQHVG